MENQALVCINLAPPTSNPVLPSLLARLSLKESGAVERQATQTKNRTRNVPSHRSWCSAHVTWRKVEKAPLHLSLTRQTSATPRFSQLSKQTGPPQDIFPSVRLENCTIISDLILVIGDLFISLTSGFLSRCCLRHSLLRSNNKNKNPSNLLHLTFIGIILGDFAFIRRTMQYDLPISQVFILLWNYYRKTVLETT